MFDFKATNYCNHGVLDERMDVDGSTPNYFYTLNHECNGDRNKIVVRDIIETDGFTTFNPLLDGITDFTLGVDNKTLIL